MPESGDVRWGEVRPLQSRRFRNDRFASSIPATPFVQLQRKLVQDRLRAIDDLREAVQIRAAAQEASALSWASGFPLLTFPVLFDERSAIAIARVKRQAAVYERSRQLLGLQDDLRETVKNPSGQRAYRS